jgi:hypothetical protein
MPNHCANRLTVTGTFEERQKFVDEMKGCEYDLDFNKIVPEPVDDSRIIGWRIKHWGSKWGAYECELDHNDDKTVYTFHTAWSPPCNTFMEKMNEKFPELKFDLRYAESGCEFYGFWVSDPKDGVRGERCKEWKFQNDDIIETEDDDGCFEYNLRKGLELYADLYERSG